MQTKNQEQTLVQTMANQTSNKVITNLDELFLKTRIAKSQNIKVIYATKDLVEIAADDKNAIRVSVQGVEVQAQGYETECLKEDKATIEQVNFGKN